MFGLLNQRGTYYEGEPEKTSNNNKNRIIYIYLTEVARKKIYTHQNKREEKQSKRIQSNGGMNKKKKHQLLSGILFRNIQLTMFSGRC